MRSKTGLERGSGRRALLLVWASLLASVVLVACGGKSSSSSSSSTKSSSSTRAATTSRHKQAHIAVFTATFANPYDAVLNSAEKAEAQRLGASVTLYDGKFDPSVQVGECQDALATGRYNLFLIKAVVGPPMMPCAREALARGIKVVAVDDPLGPKYILAPQIPGVISSIISLPTTNGQALAQMTISACAGKNPCKVAYYFGPTTFEFVTETRAAFNAIIAKHPNIQIVDEASSQFNPSMGTTLTNELLTTHPDVNVITSDMDQVAVSAAKALKAAGKLAAVKVIGGGGSCVGADGIKAGLLYGDSALYPATEGRLAVDLGIAALEGKPLPSDALEKEASYIHPPGAIITKANINRFRCEWGAAGPSGA